jgi:hypothetical protein
VTLTLNNLVDVDVDQYAERQASKSGMPRPTLFAKSTMDYVECRTFFSNEEHAFPASKGLMPFTSE